MMETKICSKCGIEKKVCEFQKDCSKKDKLYSSCRECVCKKTKKYLKDNKNLIKQSKKNFYQKNKEKINRKSSEYRKKNSEKIKSYLKKYYKDNKEALCKKNKLKYFENKESILKKSKEYREVNKEKYSFYLKEYYYKNKELLKEYLYNYQKNRRKNDELFYLKDIISHRVREYLKSKKITKKNKTFEIVGCTPNELKIYLEERFVDGMCWDNRGKWHIDHIIPLSSAKTEDELYKLCHYTNLQPLWAVDNLKKGNKILSNNIK